MENLAAVIVGNGYVKTWKDGKSIVYPSIIADEQAGIDFAGFASSKDRVIEYEGKRYAIGDTVWRLGRVQRTQMDRSRIGKPFYKILFASALAAAFPDGGTISVVVTLPIGWYTKRDEVKKQLAGTYKIGVGKQQLEFKLPADNIRIIPEGFGVLATQLLDNGCIKKSEIAKYTVGIVEVGTGTTDFSMFTNLEIVPAKSKGVDIGLRSLWDAVGADILKEYGRELKPHEVDEAIQKGAFKDSGDVKDVRKFVKRHMPGFADAITGEIDSLWDSGRIADRIFFGGGGAAQVKSYMSYHNAEFVDNGHTADAKGAYLYGMFRAKKG